MRLVRHDPDYLTRKICLNFIRAARFNVTRIIKFRAPGISIFETMRAAKNGLLSAGD
jgi:hypothetical protein